MSFDIFQTATATMNKIAKDGFGDETVSDSFEVSIDPVLGKKLIYTQENEEVMGMETVISYNENIDLSHDRYSLTYNGRTYQVEGIEPFYTTSTMDIEHYEVTLR